MAIPRGTVTIGTGGGAITLVADVGQYKPFGEQMALGVTEFDGIEATTIQDFGFRAARQRGALSSGGGPESPGLISKAALAALVALIDAWGASQAFTDSLGNIGTIKAVEFGPTFEIHPAGAQNTLYSYALRWRWMTLTQRLGAAYTGP